MRFEDILGNEKLWAVQYDGFSENVLKMVFAEWEDPEYLYSFFKKNYSDLVEFFHITNVEQAIYDTSADAIALETLILDISPDASLDALFRPLENYRFSEMALSKEKAKGRGTAGHKSWLRIYAIKLEPDTYVITGGAIKLTHTMEERAHTLQELLNLEKVRNFLIGQNVFDLDSFIDCNNETGDRHR